MPRQTLKKRPDGRYVCKYKGFSFYGRTQSEALAAREEYKKQERYGRKPREKYTFARVCGGVVADVQERGDGESVR